MKRSELRFAPAALVFSCLLAAFPFAAGDEAYARPHSREPYPQGRVINRLPPRHRTIDVRGDRYHYHDGIFYKRRPSGFLAVRAPVGALVFSIPLGSRAVVSAGITYYHHTGVYYRRAPRGYLVVEPPVETVVVREVSPVVPSERSSGEKVLVTAYALNVRSGPGAHFPVVRQVGKGDLLTVHGYAPEWLYVCLPGGEFGWVMSRYTSPLSPPASG
ncbi:MAG: SH3 domain-containing protein [Deltaproteobacteria bacterium]|nr:SH3 domain-containing protein [Deltaproteobacteria bacterium]